MIVGLYTLFLIAEVYLMQKYARLGPSAMQSEQTDAATGVKEKIMFDYETLRFIWWLLIGVILVVFMISDGFDMGIGCLLPLVARNDDERRIVINSVGAHWEGNQVWLILAGGALFAAWPRVYAAAFSGFLRGDDSGAVLAVLPPAGL